MVNGALRFDYYLLSKSHHLNILENVCANANVK